MAEPINVQEYKRNSKHETEKFTECPTKTLIGTTCSVCHKVPAHSRTYYGHLFCIDCFHKYIWTPTKSGITCSSDLKNQECDFQLCEESTSK